MPEHDPVAFASALSRKLAATSRNVCVFLGAGAARACGLPDVAALQQIVLDGLKGSDRDNFQAMLAGRNLEQALSRLRRIAALIDDEQAIDKLTGSQASDLDDKVCRLIVGALEISLDNIEPMLLFAAWASQVNNRNALEVFTVNYDLLLETAFEHRRVPYFDGFIGSIRARFFADLVEEFGQLSRIPPFFVRLWKLHGSVNWSRSLDGGLDIVRRGDAVQGLAAAIYPSDTKYEESRRVPFVVLQDRFRRILERSETYAIISGYSFSDEHLNELIFDAAARRPRSEFAAFFYSAIPEAVAQRAETYPNLQVLGPKEAVLGGVRAPWRKPEDAPADVWGDRGMILGDFSHLAGYLARSAADLGYTEVAAAESPHRGANLDSGPKDAGSRPEAADEKS